MGIKKRPPESVFSEAFSKAFLLQVHPQTILSAHRHTGFTVIEPCRV